MEEVFRLRAADIYRVDHLERVHRPARRTVTTRRPSLAATAWTRSAPPPWPRCAPGSPAAPTSTSLLTATTDGLADLLGYEHSLLLLLDEEGQRLYTIASRGYDGRGHGLGGAGRRGAHRPRRGALRRPIRVGNLGQMAKYSTRGAALLRGRPASRAGPVAPRARPARRREPRGRAGDGPGPALRACWWSRAASRSPSPRPTRRCSAWWPALVATAVEAARSDERADDGARPPRPSRRADTAAPPAPARVLRFFAADGSTFLDGDYLIKGVAGRLLWSLVGQHAREGRTEFTNREVRLDPTLELPAFRDNFESRLILLKRRLDEHEAPVRIERSGRGRFRLVVDEPVQLELGGERNNG